MGIVSQPTLKSILVKKNLFQEEYQLKEIFLSLTDDTQDIYGYEVFEDEEEIRVTLYNSKTASETIDRWRNVILESKPKTISIDTNIAFLMLRFKTTWKGNGNSFIEISTGKVCISAWCKDDKKNGCYINHNKDRSKTIIYSLQKIFTDLSSTNRGSKFYPSNIPNFFNFPLVTLNLLLLLSEENILFKDIAMDFVKTKYIPKRKLSDTMLFHSKQSLLTSYRKYKKINIPKSVNRHTLEGAIKILDVALILSEKDRATLFQMDGQMITKYMDSSQYDNHDYDYQENVSHIAYFLMSAWDNNGLKTPTRTSGKKYIPMEVCDYIRLKMHFKETISLKKSSLKKIREEHDELSIKYSLSDLKPLKIPANSKFNSLKLPKKYVRIITVKRLKQEGIWQKHCVASYDKRINVDRCAIYSLLHDDDRYTIEIRKHQNQFKCVQFVGFANQAAPRHLVDELKAFLN
ncbi:MAG: PcfJ domain-containing protein [Defluviitaleaceae bacterium]|nr:PcfJ domain-containing protein [Defluviitaleaceae bacterium]